MFNSDIVRMASLLIGPSNPIQFKNRDLCNLGMEMEEMLITGRTSVFMSFDVDSINPY